MHFALNKVANAISVLDAAPYRSIIGPGIWSVVATALKSSPYRFCSDSRLYAKTVDDFRNRALIWRFKRELESVIGDNAAGARPGIETFQVFFIVSCNESPFTFLLKNRVLQPNKDGKQVAVDQVWEENLVTGVLVIRARQPILENRLKHLGSVDVPAGRTVTVVYSDPEGEVQDGWARLSSSGEFTASLFYRIEGVGNVGVLPSTPAKHLQLFSFVEGTDTGLAWANPDPANQSALMVRVLGGEGQLQREVETTLDALGQDAFFLTEDPYLADSNGAVEIWADRPDSLEGARRPSDCFLGRS